MKHPQEKELPSLSVLAATTFSVPQLHLHNHLADPSVLLQPSYQENKLPNMTAENKQTIEKVFTKNKQFDCICSMFALHYLFGSTESTDNLVQNIKTHLKTGGYLFFTLFEAKCYTFFVAFTARDR